MAGQQDKIKQLVEVIWEDAAGNEMKRRDLEVATADSEDSLSQFLVKTRCYGWIVKEDMEAMLLGYSEDAFGLIRFKTIPKPLTCEPIVPYYRKDNVNLINYYGNNRPVSEKRRLVEVAWVGPGIHEVNVSEIGKMFESSLANLLQLNYSYGAVFAEDASTVVLKHFENELGERELQTIPRSVIQRITPFYQSGKTNSVVKNMGKMSEDSEERMTLTKEDVDKMDLSGLG
tara:strand:+ start:4023 stop:4712 length:690 start_codon:yes stop_codon:yes gene_type:complete